jgi:hypothetical protein
MLIAFLFFTGSFVFAEAAQEEAVIKVTPSILVPSVIGDREKFEEDHWISRNTSGGIDNLSFSKKLNEQDSLGFDGRAIFGNNDYNSNLVLSREGVGSLTAAFKNFRKYFDGTGGLFRDFAYTPGELGNDLNMDIGSFKLEGILAKENSPEYNLSYGRDYRNGSKSLLGWLRITGPVNRNINPTYLDTNVTVDTLKFGVKKETNDSLASAEQSWERTKGENKKIYSQTYTLATGVWGAPSTQYLNMDSDSYSTTLRYAKTLNDKVSASCGLLYNYYLGGSLENLASATNRENPASIEQNSVTLFPNISFTPLKDLLIGFGSKAEFVNKNGSSTYNTTAPKMINIKSNLYNKIFTQNLEIKYNGMDNFAWYGNAEFEKRFIRQFEEQNSFATGSASDNFSRKTNSDANNSTFRVGCKWYPLSKLNLTLEEKTKNGDADYVHDFRTGDITTLGGTYRAFYDSTTFNSHTPSVKLKYKPSRWLAYNLGYTYDSTIYGVRTLISDQLLKSKYYAHIYSGEVTLTPYEYFYCAIFYQRKNATTRTAAENIQGSSYTQPIFNANFDVWRFNYGYAITKNSTIDGGYSMYNTENFNDFSSISLPLGVDNTAQDVFIGLKQALSKDRSWELKYTYAMYDEDSNNNVDDYEAHIVYAAMNLAF